MICITSEEQLGGHCLLHGVLPKLINTKIICENEDNFLFCEPNVILKDSIIAFRGSGNVCFLSSNNFAYVLNMNIYKNSLFYMGKDNYMNGKLNILIQEHQNLIIGNDCMFSYGIWISTGDAHLIYDIDHNTRINESKSVFIGDHVWLGQYSSIYKGSSIGSGTIVGGNSIVSGGKRYPSNSCIVGNPGRIVKSNIFWLKDVSNCWDKKHTKLASKASDSVDKPIYTNKGVILNLEKLDESLKICDSDKDMRLKIAINISNINDKNRFYIHRNNSKKE